jgi:hypothetical protein
MGMQNSRVAVATGGTSAPLRMRWPSTSTPLIRVSSAFIARQSKVRTAARRCLGRPAHDLELALGVGHIARSPLKGGFFGHWKLGVHLRECSRHGGLLCGGLRRAHASRLLQ